MFLVTVESDRTSLSDTGEVNSKVAAVFPDLPATNELYAGRYWMDFGWRKIDVDTWRERLKVVDNFPSILGLGAVSGTTSLLSSWSCGKF